jgi:hypothetical protein
MIIRRAEPHSRTTDGATTLESAERAHPRLNYPGGYKDSRLQTPASPGRLTDLTISLHRLRRRSEKNLGPVGQGGEEESGFSGAAVKGKADVQVPTTHPLLPEGISALSR